MASDQATGSAAGAFSSGGTVSKTALKRLTGEFDLESVFRLDLNSRGLESLGCLPDCSGLEFLSLSGNRLADVSMLGGLKRLRYLDLSANRLASLAGLEGCEALLRLDLAGNLVACTEDLHALTDLANLESLQLQDKLRDLANPICLSAGYAEKIVDLLPGLTCLDGIRVRGSGDAYYQLCLQIDQALSALAAEHDATNEQGGNPDAASTAASSRKAAVSGLGEAFWSLEASTAAASTEATSAERAFADAVSHLRDTELQTMLCLEEWERDLKKRKA